MHATAFVQPSVQVIDQAPDVGRTFVSIVGSLLRRVLTGPSRDSNRLVAGPEVDRPRDCALVIDASGSMQSTDWKPSRSEGAKEAAKTFCQRLATEQPDARVAVIAYGSRARVFCKLTRARDLTKISRAIDAIGGLGSTNIKAGLKQAHDILRDQCPICQVIFLSDGHNTEQDPKPVADALKEFAVIECVGIGGSPQDVDEELMKYIASEHPDGSKRYRWIGDKERLVKHFHNLAGRIRRA